MVTSTQVETVWIAVVDAIESLRVQFDDIQAVASSGKLAVVNDARNLSQTRVDQNNSSIQRQRAQVRQPFALSLPRYVIVYAN